MTCHGIGTLIDTERKNIKNKKKKKKNWKIWKICLTFSIKKSSEIKTK